MALLNAAGFAFKNISAPRAVFHFMPAHKKILKRQQFYQNANRTPP
jgi:hypothetical protein